MAYVYDRTWNFSFDNAYTPSSAADETSYEMWALGSFLLGQLGGLTLGLWTIAGSSNGVAAGMDAVDRLHLGSGGYTAGDWVRGIAGAAHSWYVFQSPTMNGQTFYMLVSWDTAVATAATILMSKAAFTGGSTTANPTSTDSWFFANAANPTWNAGNTNAHRFSMCLSTTGDFIYFVVRAGVGRPELGCMVLAPVGCEVSDAYPIWQYFGFSTSTSGGINGDALGGTNTLATRLTNGLGGFNQILVTARWFTAVSAGVFDSVTGKVPDYTCWVNTLSATAGNLFWHRRGRLPDVFFCGQALSAAVLTSGTTVKDAGVVIFETMGSLIIPANAASNMT